MTVNAGSSAYSNPLFPLAFWTTTAMAQVLICEPHPDHRDLQQAVRHPESRFFRHLGLIILIKLLILAVLWWNFVRDSARVVTPAEMARQFAPAPTCQGDPHDR